MAGLIMAFQACKKADNTNNNNSGTTTKPAAVPCFTSAHSIIDSNQVDTFNASCSQNAVSYSWSDLAGATGSGVTWTKYFIHRSGTSNQIQLSVKGPDGNTKNVSNNVICGFQQYQSITITKLPAGFTDSFYLTCGPIAGSTPKTATIAASSLPVTIALGTPLVSISQTANNTGKWIIRIEDTKSFSTEATFTFYPGAVIASPYARTTIPIASLDGKSSINLNYIISAN